MPQDWSSEAESIEPQPRERSRLGIASLALTGIAWSLWLALGLRVAAAAMLPGEEALNKAVESLEHFVVPFFVLVGFQALAFVLGIVALLQKQRTRGPAIAGLFLSAIGLMFVGLSFIPGAQA